MGIDNRATGWRRRAGPPLPYLLAVVAVLLTLAFSRIGPIDDAFITYRYSRNLALGHGLVFNPGERVEGSTSLLWTVLLAAPIGLRLPIEWVAPTLGLGFGLLALLDAWRLCRFWARSTPATLLALLALGLYPGFWLVLVNGMEGGLCAFLLTRTVATTVRGRHAALAGGCAGLLFLARPEGAIVGPLCAAYVVAAGWRAADTTRRATIRRAGTTPPIASSR